MARHRSHRRLRLRLGISVLFGLFVIFDIALFAWLIFKSLSQREIEQVLLETREEAAPLARALQEEAERLGQDDLYVIVSVTEQTHTFVGSVLNKREIMRSVEIRDREGTVVFKTDSAASMPVDGDAPDLGDTPDLGLPPRSESPGLEAEIPIGDLGSVVIGLSEEELQRRVRELRGDLVQQASLVGALTLTLMAVAFAAIVGLSKRAERLEEQAEEAERMAYVGTLASGLAHEIRNPLNSLNLNMQMLEEEARASGRDGGRLMAITRSELLRLEGLVTDFLAYARPRPLEMVETTPAALFERLLEVLEGEIRDRGVEVTVDDRAGGARVSVDRDQVGQLLLNLAQNALAATADTGRPGPQKTGHIRLMAELREASVALSVRDNGCGIPEKDLGQIFDLFYSTRKGGTGLGLAIVERIAHSHGGEVEAVSVPGEGTTITVLLPARVAASPRPGPRTPPGS